jgi:alcohol dehydrogenase (NADP+)
MTMNVLGYAAPSAKAALTPYQFERRDIRADDVAIEILYCGICHSDVHEVNHDWDRNSIYPMVPGHEIIGRVVSIGTDVTRFKPGDQVGVGCMVDSCQNCPACKQGFEQYCEKGPTLTYDDKDRYDQMPTYGGYSEKIIVKEKFVLRIPKGLDLKGAGPLLCAGITTWSPLRHWRVGQGTNVGVIGLDGLGHMALKLTKALGANVTLIRYVHDLNPYLPALSINGTLVLVGLLGNLEPTLNTVPLIMGRKSVAGSAIGGIAETQELLDFCGEHGITADVEVIKIQEVNEAYKRMLKSDVKYRFVIDMASLKVDDENGHVLGITINSKQ